MLGFKPGNVELYLTALSHRSVKETAEENNERLEYLGDAILSAVVADYLFMRYPKKGEGFLTEMRSKMVNRQMLNDIALKMGVKKITQFNKIDSALKNSQIFGNTLEALVGAIYLDKGFDFTKKFIVNNILSTYIDFEELIIQELSYKAKLVKWAQKEKKKVDFNLKNIELENKRKIYEIAILIDGEEVIVSKNHSKKIAEELASEKFCLQMSI